MSLLVAPTLPTASPFSTEGLFKVSVLVPVPVNCTDAIPPEIVPAFITVPLPVIPNLPPLIVPPEALVTSTVLSELMPISPPVMVPPVPLFTLTSLVPRMATPPAAVASMLPALRVTLMFGASMARELPPLSALMVPVPLATVAVSSRADGTAVRGCLFDRTVIVCDVDKSAKDSPRNARDDPTGQIVHGGCATGSINGGAIAAVPIVSILPALLVTLTDDPLMPNVFPAIVAVAALVTVTVPSLLTAPPTFTSMTPALETFTVCPSIARSIRVIRPPRIVDRDRCTRNTDTTQIFRARIRPVLSTETSPVAVIARPFAPVASIRPALPVTVDVGRRYACRVAGDGASSVGHRGFAGG